MWVEYSVKTSPRKVGMFRDQIMMNASVQRSVLGPKR